MGSPSPVASPFSFGSPKKEEAAAVPAPAASPAPSMFSPPAAAASPFSTNAFGATASPSAAPAAAASPGGFGGFAATASPSLTGPMFPPPASPAPAASPAPIIFGSSQGPVSSFGPAPPAPAPALSASAPAPAPAADGSTIKYGKLNRDFMSHVSKFIEEGTDDILDLSNCARAYLKYCEP